ncbi:hybrid sensor histidine kinase/response regulator [Nitratidesulfovibrio liaohensis]|uniref:hybrid sensor histidine kinase/response regulator n=1 Tax=Nitratidesulfovibrio liaohensis TaxID=2604158 RepID=UPI001FB913C5|nr:ABC transporter substrate binding protein [Nitratidesulfovibrio liaohensis]
MHTSPFSSVRPPRRSVPALRHRHAACRTTLRSPACVLTALTLLLCLSLCLPLDLSPGLASSPTTVPMSGALLPTGPAPARAAPAQALPSSPSSQAAQPSQSPDTATSATGAAGSLGAQEGARKNVLYLNSYHNGYAWSDHIQEGIRQTLAESPYSIVFQVEYMDSKKFHYQDTVSTLYALYRDKFRNKKFDIIIASDNVAVDFLLQFGEELFPGVPIVFCGLNDVQPETLRATGREITGVLENYDVAYNIELALRLNPQLRRMVIIGDDSVTGAAIRNQVLAQLGPFKDRLVVEEWSEYSLDQMLDWVRDQTPDTFFYFVPIYRDIDGQFYSAEELLEKVHAASRAPLYSNWAFLLGHGIVGGKLISGVRHGEMAARMAMQVLSGIRASSIPIVEQADQAFMFDNNELQRLFISPSQLPPDSIIINEPSRFYELNKQVFWTIIVSMVILSVTLVLLVMNILEKRRVEGKIKDQLSFLRSLMDTIPIPIYSKDADGRVRECNVAFERFFGVDREALLGRYEWQAGPEGVAMLRDASDTSLMHEPGVASYETTLPGPEGSPHSIIMHKATYRNSKGAVAGLVGVVFDYTDRKKAEDRLRAAEEKYRSLFESSPLGIFRVTPDGDYLDANPAMARMSGYASPALLLASGAGTFARLHGAPDMSGSGPGMGQDMVISFDSSVDRPGGDTVTMHLTMRPHLDEAGKVRHIEGYAEDITQRKAAERALSASQRMLQLVLDNIPQFVYWKDRDLKYMGANKSFLGFVGLDSTDALLGRTDEEVLPSTEDAARVHDDDEAVVRSGQPRYQTKITITSPGGEAVWLETNRVPLLSDRGGQAEGDGGDVVGLLTTAEDVTQRIRLERQLLQSQKMEAIGTLAGGISHDFNNILTSIINSIELAISDIAADSLTCNDLMRALKAAQRGSRLVKQILTFSRPSVEGFVIADINEVLNEALVLIKASLPRNIEIRKAIPPRPSITRADPTQIHQVLMNLCTNSFQALRDTGGVLEVNLEQEMLSEERALELGMEPGCALRLTVADDGPGIAPEIVDKIFDPFFTTKGKTEGTGLGLAVVHGIIKGHRGAVRVASVPWRRTEFEIYLPMHAQDACLIDPALLAPEMGSERILFVEDDDDQLHTIPRVLESLGYTVRPFKNPLLALAAVREHPASFDLVITDFDMPEANGLELARKMGDIAPNMPIILVSGREVAAEGAAVAGNIKAMVHKPYNRNILADAIRRVFARLGS